MISRKNEPQLRHAGFCIFHSWTEALEYSMLCSVFDAAISFGLELVIVRNLVPKFSILDNPCKRHG